MPLDYLTLVLCDMLFPLFHLPDFHTQVLGSKILLMGASTRERHSNSNGERRRGGPMRMMGYDDAKNERHHGVSDLGALEVDLL